MLGNHQSILIKDCYVYSKQLIDDCEDEFLSCDVIGICVYENECLTFLIRLEDGEVFSYIPPTSVFWKVPSDSRFSLEDLCYVNSPDNQISISQIENLKGMSSCYIKRLNKWISSEYLYTIDFFRENELLNLMKFENGNFAFLPFHKIKFKQMSLIKKDFKKYKKQRLTYKL